MIKLTKRQFVRLISFATALIILVAGSSIAGFSVATRYKQTIEQGYRSALSELSDYFSSIQSSLEKGFYSNTNTSRLAIASKLCSDTSAAKEVLSRLPVTPAEAEPLQKYLSQVGDFGKSMISSAARGYAFSQQNRNTLQSLCDYAQKLSPALKDAAEKYSDGSLQLGVEQGIQGNLTETSQPDFALDTDFTKLNEDFTDYPTLIYDGPFADSTLNRESIFLQNLSERSDDEARETAAKFLSVTSSSLIRLDDIDGTMPCYNYSTTDGRYITVTKQGGHVAEMSGSASPQKASLSYEQACESALNFLSENGINNMMQSYYAINNNICVINFAYSQEGVICYGDLIKVGVSLENGEILSYNAENYLMNHCLRSISPYLTESFAQRSVSPYLTVKESRLCVIPTQGGTEYLCYEFLCMGTRDEEILVYINADTGLEEEILILLKSDGGVFTI